MAPTMIAGGVLYPPSLLWSLPFVPNLLYANVFTMLCIEEPGDASRDDIRRSLRLDDVVRK